MPHEVNVSVADDYLYRFDEAVRRLEQAGLKVQERLPAIGLVAGSIDAVGFESLARLPEVSGVERSRPKRLSSPPNGTVVGRSPRPPDRVAPRRLGPVA